MKSFLALTVSFILSLNIMSAQSSPATLSRLQTDRQNPRHFADTLGNPVLLTGDSPQNLPQKLTTSEMRTYFQDCRDKGINLCWVCIDGQPTASSIKEAPADRKGNPEFMPGGSPENWDLQRVNTAYYSETIDSVLILAESYGIYVNLMPMSQCYWSEANISANSPSVCYSYGEWLGKRYRNQRNILWLFGNDNLDSSRQCPIARGIRHSGDNHLMSVHVYNPKIWGPDPEDNSKGESGNFFKHLPHSTMGWITYNNLYSDMEVFNQASFIYHEYKKSDVMPIIMSEGPYQKLKEYSWQVATNQVERGLNYIVAMGGGFGGSYIYGSDWLQRSTIPWDKYLNKGARPHIKYFSSLFNSRHWWNLIPDWSRQFLISTTLTGGSDIEKDDYTMAAFDSVKGEFGVVYCTEPQTVTINLSKISGNAKVRWYDPTSGDYINIKGAAKGLQRFTTPTLPHEEYNTDGSEETSNDWVLVVEKTDN
jgi:Protein of unknown function (DUF4038)/Putative collagen-binding domain of a collagenase